MCNINYLRKMSRDFYTDYKSRGREHYERKRLGKICLPGQKHRINPIRFDPFTWLNRFYQNVYEEPETYDHEFNFFGNYFYSPTAFRALAKYYNFANMSQIVQFLKDIDHFTPENLKKMVRIVYLMKNNRYLMGNFCYECESYECEIKKAPKKKKKTVNRKFVNHFDEKTNEYYNDVSVPVGKKKPEKKQCNICYQLKPKCVTLPKCGKTICRKCEEKMSFSKTGCYFCRQHSCLRHPFQLFVVNGPPIDMVFGEGAQELFRPLVENLQTDR